jgi:large subunit ribosomal protein L18Ae
MALKEYCFYVSEEPREGCMNPQVFQCTVFAKDEVRAGSILFRTLRIQQRLKSTGGVILKTTEVPQHTDMKIRTFGVRAVYRSGSGLHNYYREIRSINKATAVERLYQDVAGKHHAPPQRVTIIEAVELEDSEVTSKELLQLMKEPTFPLFENRVPANASCFEAVPVNY